MAFEPLRITAHLRAGVAADRWLPLDGILLYQACREALGPQDVTTPGGSAVPGGIGMPLQVRNAGTDDWYYACSWAQPQPWWCAEGRDHWNKRFDSGFASLVDFGNRRGKVIVEQGQYKAYHMPLFYYAALQVEWYAVGHRDSIARLLSTCMHIGKKGAQGWGRVARWEVEPWPADWSTWRDGRLTRGVPSFEAPQVGSFLHYGLRPSYYRRENQRLLAVPE